jgi:hypothetical protein
MLCGEIFSLKYVFIEVAVPNLMIIGIKIVNKITTIKTSFFGTL